MFGGSGTVLLGRPVRSGCLEVYNDYNSDLTNLFFCTRERTLALLLELGFLPLNSRDEFEVLLRFLKKQEVEDEYTLGELELAERFLPYPEYEEVRQILLVRAECGDVKRAAAYYRSIRYSFSAGGKSFGGRACNIRSFFWQIWECSRRLSGVVIENKDYEALIAQYDREDAFIYCDPPYYEAEDCYAVEFPKEDHYRLHSVLLRCRGKVMLSYNYCEFIQTLYREFYIFYTTRHDSMSQTKDKLYEEAIITNYDPRESNWQLSLFNAQNEEADAGFRLVNKPEMPYGTTASGRIIFYEESANKKSTPKMKKLSQIM